MLATIQFSGFYESIHDSEIDGAIDNLCSFDNGHINEKLRNNMYCDGIDFQSLRAAYAQKYAKEFAHEASIDMTFDSMASPKYYNFETDRIFCNIEFDEVKRISTLVKRDTLAKVIQDNFTSYDGFHSFYDNKLENWDTDFANWDCHEIGALIEAYLIDNFENPNIEYSVIGNIEVYNLIYDHLTENGDRYMAIFEYLRNRNERV